MKEQYRQESSSNNKDPVYYYEEGSFEPPEEPQGYRSDLLSAALNKYIHAYDIKNSDKWKEEVYECILLQTDLFNITDQDKENLKEYVTKLESSLKNIQEHINKENSKNLISKWINNIINFVMRTKSTIQLLHEKKDVLLNEHPSIANFSGTLRNKRHSLEDAGNFLLRMNDSLKLLDKLRSPTELQNMSAEDVKKLYYLSIHKFSGRGNAAKALIKTEEFDDGTELCEKDKMIGYLNSMIEHRRSSKEPINEKEILEVKMATSLSTFENYKGQLDSLKKSDPSGDYREHQRINDKLSSIKEDYELQYDDCVIQDIATKVTGKNQINHSHSHSELTAELSKYKKYIRQIGRNNIDDFEEALTQSLKLERGITASIKNAFHSVKINIPNAEFVSKKGKILPAALRSSDGLGRRSDVH